MRILHSKAFRRSLRGLPDGTLQDVAEAMAATAAAFGQPHLHSGLGIRRLRKGFYECRCGRALRLVFEHEGDALTFDFAGNHDDVRRYLHGL